MGFFQSLKDDISEAVDGIFDEEDTDEVSGSKESGSEDDLAELPGETELNDDLNLDDLTALLDAVKNEFPDEDSAADADEDYSPATPEEIAAFEASSDDDENAVGDLFDPAELDKLMADIASIEEASSADASGSENTAEADSTDVPDKETIKDTKEAGSAEEKASGETDKDTEATASEEDPAKEASAEETTPEEESSKKAPAEEKTAEEAAAGEMSSDEKPSEETASEDKASEENGTAPDAGEQMTISQMMGIGEENTEVIKQAEAMAEAAAIADIKEAEETAKAEAEAATAERVAEFEVDAKPRKKARKKTAKADKADKSDIRVRAEAGPRTVSDETAVFAEGMSVKGDVESDGSLELSGVIEGNIDIAGKLKVSGIIKGNTTAGELYADGAEINGDINCSGSVKVGQSTIIIGNITGSSAVIAGAVKGNIDVHGPVILDSVAIVMGDIRSQSLQISNGAAVEGMCSQVYSPVTPADFFGDK